MEESRGWKEGVVVTAAVVATAFGTLSLGSCGAEVDLRIVDENTSFMNPDAVAHGNFTKCGSASEKFSVPASDISRVGELPDGTPINGIPKIDIPDFPPNTCGEKPYVDTLGNMLPQT